MPDFKVELNVFSLSKGVFIGRWLFPLCRQNEDIWLEVKEAFAAKGLDISSAFIRLRNEYVSVLTFGAELVANLKGNPSLATKWLKSVGSLISQRFAEEGTFYLLLVVNWQVRDGITSMRQIVWGGSDVIPSCSWRQVPDAEMGPVGMLSYAPSSCSVARED